MFHESDGLATLVGERASGAAGTVPAGAGAVGPAAPPQSAPEVQARRMPLGKRAFDIAFALTALLLLAPLLLLLSAVTAVVNGFPIIFRQERVTAGGRVFTLYKFRSLPTAADRQQAGAWSFEADRRPGPWGAFLRASSLDELPQLVNILKGDMSLVGPRPERPEFVSVFSATVPDYAHRHRVVGGLTGWAQVNGLRGATCLTTRAAYDNDYIERRSAVFDLIIILRTFAALTRGSG